MNKFASSLSKIGLNSRHRIIAEGGIPPLQYDFEREKWAMGERFGQYGMASGVDIRKLWPSIEEIEDIKALRMYRKASEAQKIAEYTKRSEEFKRKNKLDKIEANWKKHDKMLAEYLEEKSKAVDEKTTQEQELQRQVREVQEYFGYYVDPRDPRFRLMLSQKEEKAKMEAKLEKQKEKKSSKKQAITTPDVK